MERIIDVKSTAHYNVERGYGFVKMQELSGKTDSERALFGGGWNLRKSIGSDWVSSSYATEKGVYVKNPREVIVFRITVPAFGRYEVTVRTDADTFPIRDMRLYTGRRNLVASNINIDSSSYYERKFCVCVTPYIPALTSIPCEDKSIYISVCGENAGLSQITVKECDAPTLFIAGDSTLTDQNALEPYYPYKSCGGWAQYMSQYFEDIAVCNYAHSGLTTNCFRDDGHWDILAESIRPGDTVMLQFGHNDQKRRNLAAFGGYINNLRWYVKQIRELGATPIICSPISRIPFDDPEYGIKCSLLKTHALAARQAAEELLVPFINLHDLTFTKWLELGDNTPDYFIDVTHTNDYGAQMIAQIVSDEIRFKQIKPLIGHILQIKASSFKPDMDTKDVLEEPSESGMFDIDIPYVDIKGIPQYDSIVDAFRGGLLDPCIMHLHPTDFMPRAQVLMVLFKALRIEGTRPYHGKYTDIARYEWDSSYIETSIRENLIDESTTPGDLFRPDEPLTAGEFASLCERGIETDQTKRNITLKDAYEKALEHHILPQSLKENDIICRADVYAGLSTLMRLMNTADKSLPSDAEIHPV